MIAALIVAAVYPVLFIFLLVRRRTFGAPESWLAAYLGFSTALMGLHAIILSDLVRFPPPFTERAITLTGLAVSISLVAALTVTYLEKGIGPGWWLAAMLVWAAAVAVAEAAGAESAIIARLFSPGSIDIQTSLGIDIAILGWLVLALILLILTSRAFLTESLPLYANRILFWAVVVPVLLLGDALAAWLRPPWNYLGYGLRLAGALAAVYSVTAGRIIDLRDSVGWIFRRAALAVIGGLIILLAILSAVYIPPPLPEPAGRWLVVIGAALSAALLLPLAQRLVLWMAALSPGVAADPAEAVRLYGQQIAGVIEISDLATIALDTINRLLNTRRGYLILTAQGADDIHLEVIGRSNDGLHRVGTIASSSPLFRRLLTDSAPILQYDIDYDRDLAAIPAAERRFFSELAMDIYAPIVRGGRLMGIIALGPKSNDKPFDAREIALLSALAHQTVPILENARLLTDLRVLNEEVNKLNEELRQSNERLEALDAVKTDFITIASHELRTPLTQIQGYGVLITEMSERGVLDKSQMTEMTTPLLNAVERMAAVVTSMLDVAQMGLEGVALTFDPVGLSGLLTGIISMFAETASQRRLTVETEGFSTLPSVYGDSLRLSQAFQNLLSNAIKFTPDGGRITIKGGILSRAASGAPESVQVVVTDTGIGIDPAKQELIFEKFYRASPIEFHSSSETRFKGAGPGLGLVITRAIVEGHGGRIWVESPGHDEKTLPGSAFHVVLPIRPPTMDLRRAVQAIRDTSRITKNGALITNVGSQPQTSDIVE